MRRLLIALVAVTLLTPAGAEAKHRRHCIPPSSPRYDSVGTPNSRLCHPLVVHRHRHSVAFDPAG